MFVTFLVFFSTLRKITVGGFVNQLITKFWPNGRKGKLIPTSPPIYALIISYLIDGWLVCAYVFSHLLMVISCKMCILLVIFYNLNI